MEQNNRTIRHKGYTSVSGLCAANSLQFSCFLPVYVKFSLLILMVPVHQQVHRYRWSPMGWFATHLGQTFQSFKVHIAAGFKLVVQKQFRKVCSLQQSFFPLSFNFPVQRTSHLSSSVFIHSSPLRLVKYPHLGLSLLPRNVQRILGLAALFH